MSSSKSFLADFGINSATVLSNAIVAASRATSERNHASELDHELTMSNMIVLSASVLGATYMFSTSLPLMNRKWVEQKKSKLSAVDVLTGIVMFFSGGVVLLTSIESFRILRGRARKR